MARKFKIPVFILTVACLLLFSGCATLYNPATGRREFIVIPTHDEVVMGSNLHKEIIKETGPPSQGSQAARLREIGEKLAQVSDRKDYEYHFYLVDKEGLNAFTTPGGNIYFHKELMDKLGSDEEIAAVLAHEIGHCAARHTIKKFQAALGYNIISALVLSQVNTSSTTKAAIALAGNSAMSLAMSAYSRKDEYEADRLGIKYMYLAGYNLDGMIKALELLERESKGPEIPLFLRTHPYLSDRIKTLKKEIVLAPYKYD